MFSFSRMTAKGIPEGIIGPVCITNANSEEITAALSLLESSHRYNRYNSTEDHEPFIQARLYPPEEGSNGYLFVFLDDETQPNQELTEELIEMLETRGAEACLNIIDPIVTVSHTATPVKETTPTA